MTLQCTRKQFEALHHVFQVIMQEKATDISASLIQDLMRPIQLKMQTRLNARLSGKKAWNLALTDLQAKTYYCFFKDFQMGPKWHWEGIIIQQHLIEIEKIYG